MLMLTRRRGDAIEITQRDGDGPDIKITICEVKGGTVRVGIQAPQEYRVSRLDAPRGIRPMRANRPAG